VGGAFGKYGRRERCTQGFGGDIEGKRPLGRPGVDGKKYIEMYLQDVG
jgi:hypothetical protein